MISNNKINYTKTDSSFRKNLYLLPLLLLLLSVLFSRSVLAKTLSDKLQFVVVDRESPVSSASDKLKFVGHLQHSSATTLELGRPIERELLSEQKHSYQIVLAEGQYAGITVEQRGIDVVVQLLKDDGKQIAEADSDLRVRGLERIEFVADATGTYVLNVQAKQSAPPGSYEIRVTELRVASDKDRALEEVRKLATEANTLVDANKSDEARPLAERVLAIREEALGPDHPDVARALYFLARIHYVLEDFAKAEPLYRRSIAIREKILGLDHPDLAASLSGLAHVYFVENLYSRAKPLYQRALEIKEKAYGPVHPEVGRAVNYLANNYEQLHDYAQAELLYQRSLTMAEKLFGTNHEAYARALSNLGNSYRDRGDYASAERLLQRALEIFQKSYGKDDRAFGPLFITIGNLYFEQGEYAKAESFFERFMALVELSPNNLDFTIVLNNLGNTYVAEGKYAKAEPLFQRALAIEEKVFGPDSPRLAHSLNYLADVYRAQGDYEKAEPLYRRALMIFEKCLGNDSPDLLEPLRGLAILYRAKGDNYKSVSYETRANDVVERNVTYNLMAGSERQKLAYLASLSEDTYRILSLHLRTAPENVNARALAATTVLQRKGRVLDAMADSLAALRRRFDPQDQVLLDQLNETTTELANLALNGPQGKSLAEHQNKIRVLELQKEKLETDISHRSSGFYQRSQPITLAAVQAALPSNAALIEFAIYRPFDPRAKPTEQYGLPRYVVYVLRRNQSIQFKDLGEAKPIDESVRGLLGALRDPKRKDMRQLARLVDEKVMQPIRGLLGDAMQLFISPDGELNLLSFAALVDEQEHYLIERYALVYLTSGRDLLRMRVARESKAGTMVIANPLFGEPSSALIARTSASSNPAAPRGRRRSVTTGRELVDVYFAPLGGAAEEAQSIRSIFPEANLLTGLQATESALKQVASPRILHIATHGFFLQDAATSAVALVPPATRGISATARIENPLLRSGLALTGANLRAAGTDDGILTALEASGLNLWGTKLVVLSACDTGLGEIHNGEGVYGLRRAFVLAGAESLVMSLWPVSDYSTRGLMTSYYRNLKQGKGRGAALRQVQLDILKHNPHLHPFYWANFIQLGEWANLDGRR